jgi:hypothetical protein
MLDELRDRVIAYLAQNCVCVICTSGSCGAWAITTHYTNDGLELTCQVPRWADVLFHLEHDPHALVIVLGNPHDPLCWLEYRGLAHLLDASDDRYVTVYLTPIRIDLLDEQRGWGVRETLDL